MAWLFSDLPQSRAGLFDDDMAALRDEMDRLFSRYSQPRDAFPPVNVWAGEDSVAVTAPLSGVKEDDIELNVEGELLTISGTRRPPENAESQRWHRRERPDGAFTRQIRLPFAANPDEVKARYTNGILEIELPRPASEQAKKIEIRTS